MLIIPFKEFPAFTEEITLDGRPYKLTFIWNTRGEFWSLSFYTRQDVHIAAIKLVLNYELIDRYPDYNLPPGRLYVIDTTRDFSPIGRYDFTNDRDLNLVYVSEAEVEELI